MSIPKISFSSETPILSSMHSKATGTVSNPAQVQQNPVNTTPEQTPAVDNAAPEETKEHTVRNWTIGLSAAAVLTTLGVISGRKGYLGKNIQKFLGGVKKEGSNLADDLSHNADHAANDIPPTGSNVSKPNAAEQKADDVVDEAAGKTEGKVEEPPVETKETVTPEKKPSEPETTEPLKPAADKTPKVIGDTTLDRDAINAKLDRTLPKIDAPLTIKIPDTLEGIDISGMKGGEFKIFELPNGHRKSVRLNDDGSISYISEEDSKGVDLWFDNLVSGKRLCFNKYVGDKEYLYEPNGKLASIAEKNDKRKTVRLIHVKEGTSDITAIYHYDSKTDNKIKSDHYKNNKLVSEEFYGADGENILTTVTYELY